MFEDLYDKLSTLFYFRWPTSEAKITSIEIDEGISKLAISYGFCIGENGPYTGVYFWNPRFTSRMPLATDNLKVGQPVTLRYRRDDPSVNTLDRGFIDDL